MTHTFRPATRENTQLIIGSIGASGSGKTYSLFELATGLAYPEATNADQLAQIIQSEGRNRIVSIDTERGRALHYAPPPGEKADPWRQGSATFAFDHALMEPPFSPARYQELLEAADDAGYSVIILDSGSHEWAGEGGVLEMHEAEQYAMAKRKANYGNNANDREPGFKELEAVKMTAWIKPKMQHKKLVGRATTLRAHLLIALRGEEKVKLVEEELPGGRKKTNIIAASNLPPKERWTPVCEKSFPFELTMSFILTPEQPGVPFPLKLQEQHRQFLPTDRPISIETGRGLAGWAGGKSAPAATSGGDRSKAESLTQRYIDGLKNQETLDDLASYQSSASKFLGQMQAGYKDLHQKCLDANARRYSELTQMEPTE